MTKSSPQENLGALKLAVKIMGVLLVVGTIALFIAVYIKFSNKPAKSEYHQPKNIVAEVVAPSVQVAPPAKVEVRNCDFKPSADIELSGSIVNSIRNGNTLTIITEKKLKPAMVNKVQEGNSLTLTAEAAVASPQQIVIVDLCEGEVISRLNIIDSGQGAEKQ